MTNLDGIALGTALVPAGVDVTFTHAVQQPVLILGVVINPADLGLDSIMVVTHAPEQAVVQRFEATADFPNGCTISDLGIRRVTYVLEISHEKPIMYRPLSSNGPHWFEQEGAGYLRVEVGERIVACVHNRGVSDVKVSALLLCRQDRVGTL